MTTNARIAVQVAPLASTHIDRCEEIGRSLPAWFGIEEGLVEMRQSLERGRGLVALVYGEVAGFLTVDVPFPETWEIAWMAVAPAWHRRGIGRILVQRMTANARLAGASMLHVKTIADLSPSPEYAQTRAFYTAMGFQRLIVIPELWHPSNPCLLMVKRL